MKFKKLLLLPMLFALSACDFSFSFITDLFGGKSENSISFDDAKVGKATAIPKRKKEALQKEIKNVFAREWAIDFGEKKPTLEEVLDGRKKSTFEGECFASFEEKHIENRLMKQINETYYSLPITIDKVGDDYKFGGAGGVFLEWDHEKTKEQNPNYNFDMKQYSESLFKAYEQQIFFSDSILEYIDISFSSVDDIYDSMSGAPIVDDVTTWLKQITDNLKTGLKEKMICVENNSKGNIVLDIKSPIDLFSSVSNTSGEAGFNYSFTYGQTLETCRLTFDNYCLSSAASISNAFVIVTAGGQSIGYGTNVGTYIEYKYNVDPSSCFTNSVEVLTEQQVRDLLY